MRKLFRRLFFLALLVVVGRLFIGWYTHDATRWNPRTWVTNAVERLVGRAPDSMPKLPSDIDNSPLSDPALRISLSETAVRRALDAIVGKHMDVVVDHSTGFFPHTEFVRIENVLNVEFTETGTIRAAFHARVISSSWFRSNVDVDKVQIDFIPTVRMPNTTGTEQTATINLRPIVTDFQLANFGIPDDALAALDRLVANIITDKEKSGIDSAIPSNVTQFNIEVPQYHVRTMKLKALKVTTENHYLVLAATI